MLREYQNGHLKLTVHFSTLDNKHTVKFKLEQNGSIVGAYYKQSYHLHRLMQVVRNEINFLLS